MKYLLDTDTCVYWLRGRTDVRDRWISEDPGSIAISIITVAELYYGAAFSDRPEENRTAINNLIEHVIVLQVSKEAAEVFGNIKASLRKGGTLIEDIDLLIAGTALAYNLTLVTNNIRHFDRIPEIKIESWAEKQKE